VNTRLLHTEPINQASGFQGIIQLQRNANLILVSVKQGGLDVWFGDCRGNLPSVPHLHYGQTNAPVWVPIPEGCFHLTYLTIGPPSPVLACILVGGV
jgi:hypothetical protein